MSEFEIIIIVLSSIALFLVIIMFLWYLFVFILPTIFVVDAKDKKARVSDLLSIERKVDRLINALDKNYFLTCDDFYLFDEFIKWKNKRGKSNK